MRFLLNHILHLKGSLNKGYLPNPAPGLKLVFKEGSVEVIKKAKGWRTDMEMAQALGVTRAYVSMLVKRRVTVSHNVLLRLAYLLGSINGKWWVHYEIIDAGEPIDQDHPLWNMEKYEGRMPYNRFSSSAELRKKDYKVEVRTYAQEFQRNGKVNKAK
jgi:transcriptional regulator with XRE-family HTH domain